MCIPTPLSGLGLAGKVLGRKPLALLSPAAAIMGMGKKKSDKTPRFGQGSQGQPGGAMSYSGG